jgi:predicted metal-dependent hydrolase
MSEKRPRLAALLEEYAPGERDPRYRAFFDCFNRGQYFEAHEVLEDLWLPVRGGGEGDFYKGLIQLAGAFVHWQKQRPGPMAALLRLASSNLGRYPRSCHGLDLAAVLQGIDDWRCWLERVRSGEAEPGPSPAVPRLALES